jgi:hypothetical protein
MGLSFWALSLIAILGPIGQGVSAVIAAFLVADAANLAWIGIRKEQIISTENAVQRHLSANEQAYAAAAMDQVSMARISALRDQQIREIHASYPPIDQLQGDQSPETLLSQEFATVTDQLIALQQLLQRAMQLQLQSGKSRTWICENILNLRATAENLRRVDEIVGELE